MSTHRRDVPRRSGEKPQSVRDEARRRAVDGGLERRLTWEGRGGNRPQLTIATATVFYNRFFVVQSLKHHDHMVREPRKIRDAATKVDTKRCDRTCERGG